MNFNKVKISASILSANFAKLGQEIIDVTEAGADMIHLDVMDGNFVPNLTFGPSIIKSIRSFTNLPFDAHLMINNPENFIDRYYEAGVNQLIIHYEAANDLPITLQKIRNLKMKSGVSIKPETDYQILKDLLPFTDIILVMTVNPGFGGQKFLDNQLDKIRLIAQMIKNYKNVKTEAKIELSIDGGVNPHTAKICYDLGADILIAGNYIFKNDYNQAIKNLKS